MIDSDLFTAFASGLALSVVSPVLLNWLAARERRKEKQEDYRRQEVIAARADVAAHLAQEARRVMIENQQEMKETAAEIAAIQGKQLHDIHTNVNSEKTEILQAQLSQTRISLALLHRLEGTARRQETKTPSGAQKPT